jgi:hypothetical protein
MSLVPIIYQLRLVRQRPFLHQFGGIARKTAIQQFSRLD